MVDIRQRSRTPAGEIAPAVALPIPPGPSPTGPTPGTWPPPSGQAFGSSPAAPYTPQNVKPSTTPWTPPHQPPPPPVQPPPVAHQPPSAYYTVPPAAAGPPSGPPRPPKVVLRVRLLLLALSVLAAISTALMFYVSSIEYGTGTPAEGGTTSDTVANLLGAVIAVVIVATPLVLIPTVLSILIGRGSNAARIVAIVVLLIQALFCSCFGAFLPFSEPSTSPSATGEQSFVGNVSLGVLGILIGVVSIAASILLLNSSANNYFRSVTMWRRTSGRLERTG